MTAGDVIPLRKKSSPSTSEHKFGRYGDDTYLIGLCYEWRIRRAEQQKSWAEGQIAGLAGREEKVDLSALERMRRIEDILSISSPRTIELTRELLCVCATILAHEIEDPEATLAQGPVLEIIQCIVKSLDWTRGTMKIGKKP